MSTTTEVTGTGSTPSGITGSSTSVGTPPSSPSSNKGVLIGILVTCVILLLIGLAVGLIILRRSFRYRHKQKKDLETKATYKAPHDVTSGLKENGSKHTSLFESAEESVHIDIEVTDLTEIDNGQSEAKAPEEETPKRPVGQQASVRNNVTSQSDHGLEKDLVQNDVTLSNGFDHKTSLPALHASQTHSGPGSSHVCSGASEITQGLPESETIRLPEGNAEHNNTDNHDSQKMPSEEGHFEISGTRNGAAQGSQSSSNPKAPVRMKKKSREKMKTDDGMVDEDHQRKSLSAAEGKDNPGFTDIPCPTVLHATEDSSTPGVRVVSPGHGSVNDKKPTDDKQSVQGSSLFSLENMHRLRLPETGPTSPIRESADKYSVIDINTHDYVIRHQDGDEAGTQVQDNSTGQAGTSSNTDGAKGSKQKSLKLQRIYKMLIRRK